MCERVEDNRSGREVRGMDAQMQRLSREEGGSAEGQAWKDVTRERGKGEWVAPCDKRPLTVCLKVIARRERRAGS